MIKPIEFFNIKGIEKSFQDKLDEVSRVKNKPKKWHLLENKIVRIFEDRIVKADNFSVSKDINYIKPFENLEADLSIIDSNTGITHLFEFKRAESNKFAPPLKPEENWSGTVKNIVGNVLMDIGKAYLINHDDKCKKVAHVILVIFHTNIGCDDFKKIPEQFEKIGNINFLMLDDPLKAKKLTWNSPDKKRTDMVSIFTFSKKSRTL